MQGYGVVREMEHVETKGESPAKEVLIADCGELDSDALTSTTSVLLLPLTSHASNIGLLYTLGLLPVLGPEDHRRMSHSDLESHHGRRLHCTGCS